MSTSSLTLSKSLFIPTVAMVGVLSLFGNRSRRTQKKCVCCLGFVSLPHDTYSWKKGSAVERALARNFVLFGQVFSYACQQWARQHVDFQVRAQKIIHDRRLGRLQARTHQQLQARRSKHAEKATRSMDLCRNWRYKLI